MARDYPQIRAMSSAIEAVSAAAFRAADGPMQRLVGSRTGNRKAKLPEACHLLPTKCRTTLRNPSRRVIDDFARYLRLGLNLQMIRKTEEESMSRTCTDTAGLAPQHLQAEHVQSQRAPRRYWAVRRAGAGVSLRGAGVALFSALLALALLWHPGVAAADPVKQIKLTDKQVQGFVAGYKDMGALFAQIPDDADKIDPKLQAKLDEAAKKYGFAGSDEFDDVSNNITMVMSGIDPQTKAFTEPPEMIKKEIADVKANKKMSKQDKKDALEDLNDELKDAKPVEFKENVELVTKNLDKLQAIMQTKS